MLSGVADWILNHASRQTCHFVTGRAVSWCALSWENREHPLARALIAIVGEAHAKESWSRYFDQPR
jgi:hypothetical protein